MPDDDFELYRDVLDDFETHGDFTSMARICRKFRDYHLANMSNESFMEWKIVRADMANHAQHLFKYVSRQDKDFLDVDLAQVQGYMNVTSDFLHQ